MRFAYADPPYLGYSSFYADLHPDAMDYDDPATHRALIERLCDEFKDGWVLSMTSGNLHDILPMCPKAARIAPWVKPFASFKPGVNPGYAWEPVVFMGGRKRAREDETVRDWVAANITLQRGLTGAKPRIFCRWVIDLLNALPGDEFIDLFPGSNAFGSAWADYAREKSPLPSLPLEGAA